MQKIKVKLGKRSYLIIIGNKLFNNINLFYPLNKSDKAMIITDSNVSSLYLKNINNVLLSYNIKIDSFVIPNGEYTKSIIFLEKILSYLIEKNHSKSTTIIAFGGGVIGDLSGLVAAIYKRGVKLIQVPTTLLSQVDSSIGGKSAINYNSYKNIIGTIYQPSLVLIDLFYLNTLSKREILSGLAEIIKYAVIFDNKFFNWLELNIEKIISLELKSLKYCVYYCCKLKANIVSLDEYDNKERIMLNFGHTYAHAIELHTKNNNWLHGEAVSAGMMIAAYTSNILGKFSYFDLMRLKSLLLKVKLPITGPIDMSPEDYLLSTIHDKKNLYKGLFIILPISLGKVQLFNNISTKIFKEGIKQCYKNSNQYL